MVRRLAAFHPRGTVHSSAEKYSEARTIGPLLAERELYEQPGLARPKGSRASLATSRPFRRLCIPIDSLKGAVII